MRTLIKNAKVVTIDKVFKGCVAYTDGIIDYVGKDEIAADEIIDAEGLMYNQITGLFTPVITNCKKIERSL